MHRRQPKPSCQKFRRPKRSGGAASSEVLSEDAFSSHVTSSYIPDARSSGRDPHMPASESIPSTTCGFVVAPQFRLSTRPYVPNWAMAGQYSLHQSSGKNPWPITQYLC